MQSLTHGGGRWDAIKWRCELRQHGTRCAAPTSGYMRLSAAFRGDLVARHVGSMAALDAFQNLEF